MLLRRADKYRQIRWFLLNRRLQVSWGELGLVVVVVVVVVVVGGGLADSPN